MKLSLISERRKPVKHVRMFSGSDSDKSKNRSIGSLIGLPPSKTHLLQNWDNAENRNKMPDGPRALFFTPDISLALFYGPYIVEILMNTRDNQIVRDEEHFPFGEIPSNTYNNNPEEWVNFWQHFDRIVQPPNDSEKVMFTDVWNDMYNKYGSSFNQFDDALVRVVRKIFLRRTIKAKDNTGWSGNVMRISSQNITYRGRNRIVGEYLFSDDGVCTKVLYSNGGSVSVGDKYAIATDPNS